MFKKSRRKIVAAIMSVLVLLWVGTLGVIYASSYFEMQKQNYQMLRTHAQMYTLSQSLPVAWHNARTVQSPTRFP